MENLTENIIRPNTGGQVRFLESAAFESLFWGDTGGGKTYGLLIDALGTQFQSLTIGKPAYKIPEYRGYLFRRTTNRLLELVDKGREIYSPLGAEFVYTRPGEPGPSFTFPDYTPGSTKPGAKIFTCHMEQEADKFRYHGLPIYYAGFDELTEFLISQYLYIFTRIRSTIPGLFGRIRGTTNAIGPGVKWVRKRFIEFTAWNSIKYFLPAVDPELNPRGIEVPKGTPGSRSRGNVVSELSENIQLLAADPDYKSSIAVAGEKMMRALLKKDWYAFEGQFFDMLSRDVHQIKPFDVPHIDWKFKGGMDYGNDTFFQLIVKNEEKYYRIGEWKEINKTTSQKIMSFINYLQDTIINGKRLIDMEFLIHADTNMFALFHEIEEKRTPAEKFNTALKLAGSKIRLVPVSKKSPDNRRFRVFCNDEIKSLLLWSKASDGSYIKRPNLMFFELTNEQCFESLFDLQTNEDDAEDIAEDQYDHPYDALKYAIISYKSKYQDPEKERKKLDSYLKSRLQKVL